MLSASCAALFLPLDATGAATLIAGALHAEGYRPAAGPARPRPHAFPGEWLELQRLAVPLPDACAPSEATAVTLFVVQDTARVFELACAISRREPACVFSAWRRFRGFPPVVKVFWGGQPQWKDGDDHDHEVFYAVPRKPSAEARPPGPVLCPVSAPAIEAAHGDRIARLHASPGRGLDGASHEVWVHRRSAFADPTSATPRPRRE
jgi:hypothetical protein